jgi:hypothetical protein
VTQIIQLPMEMGILLILQPFNNQPFKKRLNQKQPTF